MSNIDIKNSGEAGSNAKARGIAGKPWWPWARRLATVCFFALIVGLLAVQARHIAWDEVAQYLRHVPHRTLALAGLVAAVSFALYGTFDLLGRHITGHHLTTARVMAVAFVSYVFNLNLGAMVGGIATRYRLYSRMGLDTDTTTRIVGFSLLTNWVGYMLMAGAIFALVPLQLPPGWTVGNAALQIFGWVLLALSVGYVVACALGPRRSLSIRGHSFSLPTWRLAALQLVLSGTNWMLMSGVVYLLLQALVPWPTVLGVLLLGAVAGMIARVPAGLGVLEAVFVSVLVPGVPQSTVLGAVLGYRVLYYLVPLMVATAVFAAMEIKARRTGLAALP